MPKAVANVAVWISLRRLTHAQLQALLNWQQVAAVFPLPGAGSCGCIEEGRGFYSGAYSPIAAANLLAYCAEQGIRVTSKL